MKLMTAELTRCLLQDLHCKIKSLPVIQIISLLKRQYKINVDIICRHCLQYRNFKK